MKTTIAIVLMNFAINLAGLNKSDVIPIADFFFQDNPNVGKLIGGTNATYGQVPYQLILKMSGSFICGGSLIGKKTVLTAAHCVHSYQTQPYLFTVVANTLSQASGGETIQVTRITVHPKYIGDADTFFAYDYAVLHLANGFNTGTNVQVGQIVPANYDPAGKTEVLISGFGRISSTNNTISPYLQVATLYVVDRNECSFRWGRTIPDQVICVHSTDKSACNGDSGGPLTINGQIAGVASFVAGYACIHPNLPNGYSRVGLAADFINANINNGIKIYFSINIVFVISIILLII